MKRMAIAMLVVLLVASATPAFASYGAVARDSTTLYTDSDRGSPIGTLEKFTAVIVDYVASGTARIIHEGNIYYVANKSLYLPWDELEADLLKKGIETTWDYNRIAIRDCYIYNYPSLTATKKAVKKDSEFMACWEKDGWTLVEGNGYYGYISSSDLIMQHM